jgi:hypothetical protein
MDLRFVVNREELSNLQMEVKQIQHIQNTHADRLMRLERRQNDDVALKSVWQSPFPGVLTGTPQQGMCIFLILFSENFQVVRVPR